MTAGWSLVSTMHGIPETILPCIAHHLQTDAEQLHIYLDAPNPPVQAALADHPRCLVTVCDDTSWSARPRGRPPGVVRRQLANLRHAKRTARTEWLVHIDSDEFLVPSDHDGPLDLARELATVPPNHDWARIAPMERVLLPDQQQETIFDGVFRALTTDSALVADAYGDGANFLHNGLSGHTRGKIAFRRQTRLTLGLHELAFRKATADPEGTAKDALPPFTPITGTRLLHFEGWTPLHWTTKLLRFVEAGRLTGHNRGRQAAVNFMANTRDAQKRRALFDRVQRLSGQAAELLAHRNLLRTDPFSVATLAAKLFSDMALDFSVTAFDARHRAADPDFFLRNDI